MIAIGTQGDRLRGETAHLAGLAAEAEVERDYVARGYRVAAKRWRGAAGEIDLIFRGETGFVFVEVKRAKSVVIASTRLSAAQLGRICMASQEYLDSIGEGLETSCRVDLACLGAAGEIEIIENISLC